MTLQRILTAAVLIPLVVFAVLRGPTLLIAVLVTLLILLALREFFDLAARAGAPGYPFLTSLCGAFLMAFICLGYTGPRDWLWEHFLFVMLNPLSVALYFILAVAVLTIIRKPPGGQSFSAVGTSAAALLFVVFPLMFLVSLHDSRFGDPRLLLFLLVLIWVGDTLAFFVGRWFGRRPMAPHLSPSKTWEGAVANLVGSLLVAVIFSRCTSFRMADLLAAATLGNLAGQIGDLMESVYKRAAGAKDSGTLLPGHGGMLDRIDSLIFAAPVVWYYFNIVAQGPF